jgi:hypothetical protein
MVKVAKLPDVPQEKQHVEPGTDRSLTLKPVGNKKKDKEKD